MQSNHIIGVTVIVLMAFMILFGIGLYYFYRFMVSRRFQGNQGLESWTNETLGTRSIFSSEKPTEQWNQEYRSSSSTESRSTRSSAHRSDSSRRTYQARSKGHRRLSDIVEERPMGGFQESSPESTFQGTAESTSQQEQEAPASHGCNHTCHGHSSKPGERLVGLGIAHAKGRYA